MINKQKYKDFMIIDAEGNIIFADIKSIKNLYANGTEIIDRNIHEIFCNLNETYPTLQAARKGIPTTHFEVPATISSGKQMRKVGCAFPICNGHETVAALEFSEIICGEKSLDIRDDDKFANESRLSKNNTKYTVHDIITQDPTMLSLKEYIERLALTDSNVLIYGETGTGKEMVAQALHNGSRRYTKKFISVNCSAIPSSIIESLLFGSVKGSFTGAEDKTGFFEQAEGGTLFLDEINSLNPMLQVKLLKAVESKVIRRIGALKETKVDVRIIAATNNEPYELMKEGRLMPDLFHRLAVIYLCLPTLNERGRDVVLLADYFLANFNKQMKKNILPFSEDIQELFLSYNWPGNVRELRNVIESAFTFAENEEITLNDIPGYLINKCRLQPEKNVEAKLLKNESQLSLSERKSLLERTIVENVWINSNRNLTAASKKLGISKQLMRYKLSKYQGGEKIWK